MGWLAFAIFCGSLVIGNAIVVAADRFTSIKVHVVFPRIDYTIETSRDGDEQSGHIKTKIH